MKSTKGVKIIEKTVILNQIKPLSSFSYFLNHLFFYYQSSLIVFTSFEQNSFQFFLLLHFSYRTYLSAMLESLSFIRLTLIVVESQSKI